MEVYAVNVVAPVMLAKLFIPLLKKAWEMNNSAPWGVQRAAIINMSSILGSIASNAEGSLYHYRVTKSGLNAATKSLSIDLKKDGIMAVSMHPGWVSLTEVVTFHELQQRTALKLPIGPTSTLIVHLCST